MYLLWNSTLPRRWWNKRIWPHFMVASRWPWQNYKRDFEFQTEMVGETGWKSLLRESKGYSIWSTATWEAASKTQGSMPFQVIVVDFTGLIRYCKKGKAEEKPAISPVQCTWKCYGRWSRGLSTFGGKFLTHVSIRVIIWFFSPLWRVSFCPPCLFTRKIRIRV